MNCEGFRVQQSTNGNNVPKDIDKFLNIPEQKHHSAHKEKTRTPYPAFLCRLRSQSKLSTILLLALLIYYLFFLKVFDSLHKQEPNILFVGAAIILHFRLKRDTFYLTVAFH